MQLLHKGVKLKRSALFALILAVGAVPAPAQLGLPPVVGTVDETLQTVDRTIGAVAPTLHIPRRSHPYRRTAAKSR